MSTNEETAQTPEEELFAIHVGISQQIGRAIQLAAKMRLPASAPAVPATTGLDFGAALAWMRKWRKVRRKGQATMVAIKLSHLECGISGESLLATDWEVVEEDSAATSAQVPPPPIDGPCLHSGWCVRPRGHGGQHEGARDIAGYKAPHCGHRGLCVRTAGHSPGHMSADGQTVREEEPATPAEQGAAPSTSAELIEEQALAGEEAAARELAEREGMVSRPGGGWMVRPNAPKPAEPGAAERVLEEALKEVLRRASFGGDMVDDLDILVKKLAPLREVLLLLRRRVNNDACTHSEKEALRALDESCGGGK